MTPGRTAEPNEIGLLIYPQAQLSAVYGLTDLFSVANKINAERGGNPRYELRISHWQTDENGENSKQVFATHPGVRPPFSALVLPPSHEECARGAATGRLCCWIKDRHAEGTVLCSVCGGTFLLAETGLLDGRTATAHWAHAEEFRRRFPTTNLEPDRMVVEDGDLIIAGGCMAWVDLGLRLVARMMSPMVMLATARYLLVDPAGRQQSFYSDFVPKLNHGDAQVLKLQHWLHQNYSKNLLVSEMAARAALGERTFLRRFHRATGLKPTEYLQHWRMTKAREALESSTRGVEQIAAAVGYQDSAAFRNIFKKVVGITPSEYRSRFRLA
jgi:transcriptional regulator GlxA family with amidase domain